MTSVGSLHGNISLIVTSSAVRCLLFDFESQRVGFFEITRVEEEQEQEEEEEKKEEGWRRRRRRKRKTNKVAEEKK